MAFLGSIGKVLRVALPVVYYPTAAVGRGLTQGAKGLTQTKQEFSAQSGALVRSIIATRGTLGNRGQIDNPTPGAPQPYSVYVQPGPFYEGAYDTGIGGSPWDSSISYQTWGGYSAGMMEEDWAAGW